MTGFALPQVMGIVNATPDSFYDGGLHVGTAGAIEHGLRLLDEGADVVDIGGESTRPPGKTYGSGAQAVDESEEIARVVPVIQAIHEARPGARISVDTMKPEVARLAIRAGATMVNDVSAGRFDERMFDIVSEHAVEYVLMHGHDPRNVQSVDRIAYADVVAQVHEFLEARIATARERGVQKVLADVGLGFAKGAADSTQLLRRHEQFLDLGVPMLVGPSRKAFVGVAIGGVPPSERLFGTLGAVATAALKGAAIVRVHDVAATRQMLVVMDALLGAS